MDNEEKEIRRILETVAKAGSYNKGHIVWLKNIMDVRAQTLRNSLKDLLGIYECDCPCNQ